MKKIITLLAICLCSYAAKAELPINIGVHGGISSNKLKVDINGIKSEAKSGYMFGAFCRVNLGLIYLEPSLNYTHRESDLNSTVNEGTLKYNTFDIPVMVGLKVLDLSVVKLRAYLGPVASFPGKIKISGLDDLKSDNVMWNGKVGVGVDVWKLTFDIDYEKGLKNIGKELKAPRAFNFTLGFKII